MAVSLNFSKKVRKFTKELFGEFHGHLTTNCSQLLREKNKNQSKFGKELEIKLVKSIVSCQIIVCLQQLP